MTKRRLPHKWPKVPPGEDLFDAIAFRCAACGEFVRFPGFDEECSVDWQNERKMRIQRLLGRADEVRRRLRRYVA